MYRGEELYFYILNLFINYSISCGTKKLNIIWIDLEYYKFDIKYTFNDYY